MSGSNMLGGYRVLILGSTGMLGSAVGKYFLETNNSVCLTYRTDGLEYGSPWCRLRFDPLQQGCWEGLGDRNGLYDYVINCIGTIKPFMAADPIAARKINSVFPWELSKWCQAVGSRLIHITTDCVYSGKKGKYVESDLHDALDDYGKSKSLGEPTDCMVIRTSIIGEEIHKNASLIEWAKSQKGKEVRGFTNHYWNGITTTQYAKICDRIIRDGLWERGLFHVHASDVVNKHQMMTYFNERFDLDLTINEFETPEVCDRSLSSEKELCSKLDVPTVRDQILVS